MKIKKCDYCKRKAIYAVGWVLEDGLHPNWSCDEHLELAKLRQKKALLIAESLERPRNFNFFEYLNP